MMNNYQKVPYEECVKVTGNPRRWLRWGEGDKNGGSGEPNVRSRLVAMEFRRGGQPCRSVTRQRHLCRPSGFFCHEQPQGETVQRAWLTLV